MFSLSGLTPRHSGVRPSAHRKAAQSFITLPNARRIILKAAPAPLNETRAEELALPDGDVSIEADAVLLREAEAQRQAFIMQDTCSFLASDLKMLFEKGEITESRYSPKIVFEDPITKYDSREGYVFNIRLLRTLFNITFDLHSISVTGPDSVTARWTMEMVMWLLPWRPNLTFTGRTVYKVDPRTGIVLSHTDYWDALQRNAFLSLEGVQHTLQMFIQQQLQLTPGIETPKYVVLKKLKEYEIRRYEPYLVAEAPTGPGSGPASGSGFSELASYLFGSNRAQLAMEMTTPVFNEVQPETNSSVAMKFVMESRYSDVSALPAPLDPRIGRKREEGRYAAAIRFSGWPLDYEVVQNERLLRDLLLRDGLRPAPGYQLARYNDPSTPPMLRRNEVLIRLDDFVWPPETEMST
ncbi:hypothetical protein VOLCADRAFT_84753 [Volvox carteri f. nagariensis]|uniref:SOUL heme-binding protein n=1 Tax=Volvox carteri f. nagariensis TaxID=3068 RepID=D8UK61_VOLCA|nr:uncharacterized protein VOLCADRAFT_84753 [Volvox carteri f. nagariensis]EFJ39895.1 hypothetical protein VOLCADRAFT_84753 [Volvox carteri f. nagariensis]|eukprot:XP_002959034.1 hypothetical protein VOLCADRAFT_84753 [Volvox carteri f. nagariensis]